LEERRWRFLVRRAAPLLLANLVAVVLLFLVIFPLSGIPYAPAFFSLFWRTTLFVVVCMGMGAFISVLSKDLVFAAQVGLVINAPAFVFSGFTYPRWAMPDAVRGIANLIPLTHFLDGLVPLLMFGADVWTGIPGLLVFLLTFWGGVVLLTGRTGARFREWQGSWRHRSAARVPAPQHSTPGSGPSGPLEGRGP
jgi:ABC-type multidrug transport system permease subunit